MTFARLLPALPLALLATLATLLPPAPAPPAAANSIITITHVALSRPYTGTDCVRIDVDVSNSRNGYDGTPATVVYASFQADAYDSSGAYLGTATFSRTLGAERMTNIREGPHFCDWGVSTAGVSITDMLAL